MIRNKKGFSLLEILLVLSIVAIFASIGFFFQIDQIEKQQIKQFIRTFQSDTLYIQQMTMMTEETYLLLIDKESNTYTIRKSGYSSIIQSRKIPSDWKISMLTLSNPISFNLKGNIKNPGTMLIDTGKTELRIVFPLGKGRAYVLEQ